MANGPAVLRDLWEVYYTPRKGDSKEAIAEELKKFGERSLYDQLGNRLADIEYLNVIDSNSIDTIGNHRNGGVYDIGLINNGSLSDLERDLSEILNPLATGDNFLLYHAVTRLVEVKFFNPLTVDFEVEKTEYGIERVMIRKAN